MENDEFITSLNEEDFNSELKNSKIKYYVLIILTIALIIIISIVLLIIFSLSSQDNNKNNENKDEYIGEIICIYDIKNINKKEKIFGENFEQKTKFDIYINNTKTEFIKEYLFENIGKYEIKLSLKEKINMNNMFSDVYNLISIEMIPFNSEEKISSMENTFSNCINLIKFNNKGFFEFSEITSMKKAFYNTGLKKLNLTLNISKINDLSYSFASSSYLEEIIISSMNESNTIIPNNKLIYVC